jgi:hypothetical protein
MYFSLIVFILIMAPQLALSVENQSASDWAPIYHPSYEISRVNGVITVDGRLDDPGWQGLERLGNFAEHSPGDQVQPPVETEVMITYSDDALYVAFICYDDPALVRASFCRRDNILQDDNVLFCLDTFGDGSTGYELGVNPYGIQCDLFFSNSTGEDLSRDFIYNTAGEINSEGWIVEMEVPFSSLRFPDVEEQNWRVEFWRNHPRAVKGQYSWAAYDRDESCWLCQWGTLTGVTGVKTGSGIMLLPSLVASQAGAHNTTTDKFVNDNFTADLGLTTKFAVSSDLTIDFTINPDFSQVESDNVQIDVNSKFALFYPEKRPFFQEGADLFNSWFNAIYTRSINDPSLAGKLTGRSGSNSFEYLIAHDRHSLVILPFAETTHFVAVDKSVSNILRFRRELGEQTYLGLIATDRHYEMGGSGTVAGLDSRIRLNSNYTVEVQALTSYTSEPDDTTLTASDELNQLLFNDDQHTAAFDGEEFFGYGIYASFEREGRSWGFDADYWDRSPTFRADNGFETSNDRRRISAETGYMFRFENSSWLDWVNPGFSGSRKWNHGWEFRENEIAADISAAFRKAQTFLNIYSFVGSEVYSGVNFDGIWGTYLNFNSCPHDLLFFGGNFGYGNRIQYDDLEPGRQLDYSGWCDLKPVDRLLLQFSLHYSEAKEVDTDNLFYSGYVMRSKFNLQVTRELSARIVLQYNGFSEKWEADPLIAYQINPFSVFYLGATHDLESFQGVTTSNTKWQLAERQYFLKLQYLFQV